MGRAVRAEELMAEIREDRVFFDESGGGVTFSGGEPLSQPEFLVDMLRLCRQAGIHTALDTSGYAPWAVLEEAVKLLDLVLFDIKHLDDHCHETLTGVSNSLILSNLRRLTESATRVWLRMPVIPGCNDDEKNIRGTARLCRDLGIGEIYLLPYHATGTYKYGRLGIDNGLPEIKEPSDDQMNDLATVFCSLGIRAIIGG
jgi:pyruvate formate lyase activating enzyme